jgi:hypothetical protein
MAITVDVRANFSAFRNITAEQMADELGCPLEAAERFLETHVVLPAVKDE